jgi:hypothetical protein
MRSCTLLLSFLVQVARKEGSALSPWIANGPARDSPRRPSRLSHAKDNNNNNNHQETTITPASQQKWITCTSTTDMVAAVSTLVQPEDCVLEMGAALRDVSTALCQRARRVVLVDVARQAPTNGPHADKIQTLRRPGDEASFYPDVATFCEIPQLEAWRQVLRAEDAPPYNVLVLDLHNIVGNDLELAALTMVREFTALFPHYRVVLIKSTALNAWASRLVHVQRWVGQQQGSSSYDQRKQQRGSLPHVVATVGVREYRSTIPYTVRPGDAVLEVGCHLGTTTVLLHAQASSSAGGYALGVDVGAKIIRGAQARHPHVPFAVGDAWKTAELLRHQVQHSSTSGQTPPGRRIGFDVCYVDVGGLSGRDGLLEALSLLSALSNGLEPRCIVIKSLCVRRLSSRLVPYRRLRKARSAKE